MSSDFGTSTLLFTDEQSALWVRRCRVQITSGPAAGQSVVLEQGSVRVGSAPDNDLVIGDDKTVSRYHLELVLSDQGVLVRDLGSTNGTFYQNVKVREVYLHPDFEVRAGKTYLRVIPDNKRVALSPAPHTKFEGLLGESAAMRQIFRMLEQVSPASTTVLLEGETGTGKELIAEAIHLRSPRKEGPFVVFDAGAVPRELLESELFGHVKGSFTGATTSRRGAFERAHGGTLFLDEIGELSLDLQPKLLRVLESQKVRRIGGDTTAHVDVRVVSATNRSLKKLVAAGQFRADLYFRLAVVCVPVPPLRARLEDIPLLVDHFLGDSRSRPSEEVVKRLQQHNWPGNVRELRNLIERVAALGWHEAMIASGIEPASAPAKGPSGQDVDVDSPFKEAKGKIVESFERDYLAALMVRVKGNISEAARVAGIDRNHVTKLLHKYGILPKRPY